jgi:hypothetical protein
LSGYALSFSNVDTLDLFNSTVSGAVTSGVLLTNVTVATASNVEFASANFYMVRHFQCLQVASQLVN